MRELRKRETGAVDPETGSVLTYDRFISGTEGGFQYILAFRLAAGTDPIRFRLLTLDNTSLEAAVDRRNKNIPPPNTGEEMDRILSDFLEANGRSLVVHELDLLDFSEWAIEPMLPETNSFDVKWNEFSDEFMKTLVATIARLVFRIYSLDPNGGFYPDHLFIVPYGFRGEYAKKFEAKDIQPISSRSSRRASCACIRWWRRLLIPR